MQDMSHPFNPLQANQDFEHSENCPCFDCYAAQDERDYQEHIARERNAAFNSHPDGCFFCGSQGHHSQDCLERE